MKEVSMELDKWVGPYRVRAFPWADGTLIYFNVRSYSPGQSLARPPALDRTVYVTNDAAGRRMVFGFTHTLASYVAEVLTFRTQNKHKIIITVDDRLPKRTKHCCELER